MREDHYYSTSWMESSINHRISNVIDHANSDQHKAAMIHVRKATNQQIETYSPIARSLLTMDETTRKRIERYLFHLDKRKHGIYEISCLHSIASDI